MKSPNMMSTTGRSPVIAAPTPTPVKPASEIGVSITREGPNSSTSPDKTLNGVPASATSSPKMHTRESRRISSASASRTACANVSSLVATSGINVLIDLVWSRIRRGDRKLHRRLHLRPHFVLNAFECGAIGKLLSGQPVRQALDRIPLRLPLLLFLLRTVILAVDVANVVSGIAAGIAHEKCRPFAAARAFNQFSCGRIYRSHVLPIHALRVQPESRPPGQKVARCRLRIVRVFVVEIVLARVNYRQLPQRREIHHCVKNPLPQRPLTEETHRHLLRAQVLRGKCGARGNSGAAPDDGVRSQIPRGRIGNVHRSTLAPAIPRFFSE